MYAYDLLPRLTHLTLCGQDEDGELKFIGTAKQWKEVECHSMDLSLGEVPEMFAGTFAQLDALKIR